MGKSWSDNLVDQEKLSYSMADKAGKTRILDYLERQTGLSRSASIQRLNVKSPKTYRARPKTDPKKLENPSLLDRWKSLPKKTRTWILVIVAIILLYLFSLLTACAPQIQEVIVTQIHTQGIEVTSEIEVTRLVVVTATPPPPTPTSTFQKWSYQQAEQAIMDAGLEFESVREMTKDDYGLAPMNALEGYRFIIPSLCADCGGRLYIFDDPQKLGQMKEYYDGLAEVSAMFFSWVFVQDNVLIQISGDLPDAQALQYQQALVNMK